MKRNWQFDEDDLKSRINKLSKLLNQTNSFELKDKIGTTINQLSLYLDICLFENKSKSKEVSKDFDFNDFKEETITSKRDFLRQACQDYDNIGKSTIDLIIFLADNHHAFDYKIKEYQSTFTPNEIVENSLKVYKKHFEKLYPLVLTLLDKSSKSINFTSSNYIGSECFYDEITDSTFINIEDYHTKHYAFIHELEHHVENTIGYDYDTYLSEIGPILLEILYIDELVKQRSINASTLYFFRTLSIESSLDYLGSYFKCLKELKKFNFNVNDGRLIDILYINGLIYKKDINALTDFNSDIVDTLKYVLSFLISIDLRKKVYQDKNLAFKELESYLKNKKKIYFKEEETLINYEEYLQEIILKNNNYPHEEGYVAIKNLRRKYE